MAALSSAGQGPVDLFAAARSTAVWPTPEDLFAAQRHVAQAEGHVARQETVITRLEAEGTDTTLARELLAEFSCTLEDHRTDRDKIAAELGQPG